MKCLKIVIWKILEEIGYVQYDRCDGLDDLRNFFLNSCVFKKKRCKIYISMVVRFIMLLMNES